MFWETSFFLVWLPGGRWTLPCYCVMVTTCVPWSFMVCKILYISDAANQKQKRERFKFKANKVSSFMLKSVIVK